ncbi:dihydropteroate synthase [Streptomyces sp. NPDC004732]|uniref:dihydropteroate synthase n=1 Tax=Streptomyces sp. NPDC004732 TaxID=3154290 RepID=UPI0033AAC2F2
MSSYTALPSAALSWGRCGVMGIVNVTPDSFSDGGLWLDPGRAVAHGLELMAQGADLVDVGGESTRPGASRITCEEELRRVLPVVRGLVEGGALVSVDTMRARVARAAVDVGACLINDVSGGQADPDMAGVAARSDVPYVVMHWRGHSAAMDGLASYDDARIDVVREVERQVDAVVSAGVDPGRVIVDPGLGFAKDRDDDWELLAGIDELTALGFPVLVGASRKRFLGTLLADPVTGTPRPARGRDAATTTVSGWAAARGAWAVRVHEVADSADAVRVGSALRRVETRDRRRVRTAVMSSH